MISEEKRGRLKLLWDMYFDEMFNLCFLLTFDEPASEKIVADAYYHLYKKPGMELDGNENIRSFLYTTCRDAAIAYDKKPNNDTV